MLFLGADGGFNLRGQVPQNLDYESIVLRNSMAIRGHSSQVNEIVVSEIDRSLQDAMTCSSCACY